MNEKSIDMQRWKPMYSEAKEYYDKNGNLLVNKEENERLYRWLAYQKWCYKEGKLPVELVNLLDEIRMPWNLELKNWYIMYEIAERSYQQNGDLTLSVEEVKKLHKWFDSINKDFQVGKLSRTQMKLLEKIGINFGLGSITLTNLHEIEKLIREGKANLALDEYHTLARRYINVRNWILVTSAGKMTREEVISTVEAKQPEDREFVTAVFSEMRKFSKKKKNKEVTSKKREEEAANTNSNEQVVNISKRARIITEVYSMIADNKSKIEVFRFINEQTEINGGVNHITVEDFKRIKSLFEGESR